MAYKLPIRAACRQLLIGLENEYAHESPHMIDLPIYQEQNPVQPNFDTITRQEAGVSTSEPISTGGLWDISGFTYFYGGDITPWGALLEIAGLHQQTDTAKWTPRKRPLSATCTAYYDSLKHMALGCRSTVSFSATAAMPMQIQFQMRGLYSAVSDEPSAIPSVALPSLPTLVNAQFTIQPYGYDIQSPVIKNVSIDIARSIQQRAESSRDGKYTEIFLDNLLEPTWECGIEVERSIDWIEIWRKGVLCNMSMFLGANTAHPILFGNPDGFTAKLAAAPTYGNLDGIRIQLLRFKLLSDNYLSIQRF